MSPIRFRPKKKDEEEDSEENKEEKEEDKKEEKDTDEKDEKTEEKKFEISSEIETVENDEGKNDFEVSEEKEISKTDTDSDHEDIDKNVDRALDRNNLNDKTVELELIGKNSESNTVAEVFQDKNLIVVTLPDKSSFLTTEEHFENIKKHFNFSEDQFRLTRILSNESIEIPSFLLKQADIKNGDPLFFKFNEKDNAIEIKKKK